MGYLSMGRHARSPVRAAACWCIDGDAPLSCKIGSTSSTVRLSKLICAQSVCSEWMTERCTPVIVPQARWHLARQRRRRLRSAAKCSNSRRAFSQRLHLCLEGSPKINRPINAGGSRAPFLRHRSILTRTRVLSASVPVLSQTGKSLLALSVQNYGGRALRRGSGRPRHCICRRVHNDCCLHAVETGASASALSSLCARN